MFEELTVLPRVKCDNSWSWTWKISRGTYPQKRRRDSARRGCLMLRVEDEKMIGDDGDVSMTWMMTLMLLMATNDELLCVFRWTDITMRYVANLRCDPWIVDTFPCRIRSTVSLGCVSCWSQLQGRWDVRAHELLSVSAMVHCRHGTRYGTASGLQSRAVYEPRMACEECFSTRGTNSALLICRLIVTFPAASAIISFYDKRTLLMLVQAFIQAYRPLLSLSLSSLHFFLLCSFYHSFPFVPTRSSD